MQWVLLDAAIAAEVAGTLALRTSNGFSRMGPSIIGGVPLVNRSGATNH